MATKPTSELLDPVMADPKRHRRIEANMRLLEKLVTLRERRRGRRITQGAVATRKKRTD